MVMIVCGVVCWYVDCMCVFIIWFWHDWNRHQWCSGNVNAFQAFALDSISGWCRNIICTRAYSVIFIQLWLFTMTNSNDQPRHSSGTTHCQLLMPSTNTTDTYKSHAIHKRPNPPGLTESWTSTPNIVIYTITHLTHSNHYTNCSNGNWTNANIITLSTLLIMLSILYTYNIYILIILFKYQHTHALVYVHFKLYKHKCNKIFSHNIILDHPQVALLQYLYINWLYFQPMSHLSSYIFIWIHHC